MRINFNRLSQLAGLPANGNNKRGLNEGMSPMDAAMAEMEEEDMSSETMYEMEEEDASEMYTEEDMESEGMSPMDAAMSEMEEEGMDGMDEMIEIDEVMLVQELRRAKQIMKENKRRSLSEARNKQIFERQLKQVIDEEVLNVMDEMNLNSQWVYGNRRPKNSRQGYTNQGNMIPGFGFRR